MKLPFATKYKGIFYLAGQEIPVEEKAEEKKVEVVEKEPVKVEEKPKYTKTDISRLSTQNLQELAKQIGIKDADKLSGAKLKVLIPEKLGI